MMTDRGQSESVGIVLLTAVVVVTVGSAGAVVLADTGGGDTTRADLAVTVVGGGVGGGVAVTHNGGESIAFDDLRLVVRHGNEMWRPPMNASGTVIGDSDSQFESGECWEGQQSLDTTEAVTVRIFDGGTGTLLAEVRRYPSTDTSLMSSEAAASNGDSTSRKKARQHRRVTPKSRGPA